MRIRDINEFLNISIDEINRNVAEYFQRNFNENFPIILYGAGNIGKDVLKRLQSIGINVAGFLDDTPSKRYSSFNGVNILNQQDMYDKYKNKVNLVVCILNTNHLCSKTIKFFEEKFNIKAISFYGFSWKYPEAFSDMHGLMHPSVFIQNKNEIMCVYESLEDEKSKIEYLNQLSFRLNLDFDLLTFKQENSYFPLDLDLGLSNELVFIDAGAFDGDTLMELRRIKPEIKILKYIGIEPDRQNFKKLSNLINSLNLEKKSFLFEKGLGAISGNVRFNSSGDMNASVDKDGNTEISLISLSEIYEKCIQGSDSVYIKFDIEGFESNVINASLELIRANKPSMAISIYHKYDDFWNIALSIKKLNIGYRLYMRNHGIDATDFILYAIPKK